MKNVILVLAGLLAVYTASASAASLEVNGEAAEDLVQILQDSQVPGHRLIGNEIFYIANSVDCRLRAEAPAAAFLANCDVTFHDILGHEQAVPVSLMEVHSLASILVHAGIESPDGGKSLHAGTLKCDVQRTVSCTIAN